jgi:hypothetical protein
MQLTPEFLYLVSYGLVILMKIVCFIISYKIVKLGYNLISSGAKGEFKFAYEFVGLKADLASVSPGLLFVLLGVLFSIVAINVNKTITYQSQKSLPASNSGESLKDKVVVPDSSDFLRQFSDTLKQKKR